MERALGFCQIGIDDIDLSAEEPGLQAWLDAGFQGSMAYMARHGLKRARPAALVSGTREHAAALRDQVGDVLAPMGLRLSPEKTTVVHIDDGFDFLGFRIQRHRKPGTGKRYVYTFAAKKSVASVRRKVKAITKQGTNHALGDLLRQLNPVLRGWTAYFCHAVAKATFGHLRHYTWNRVCLLYTSPSPRDRTRSRMPSSA